MVQGDLALQGRVGIIHIHSDYSRDGRDSLEQLREFALERDISFVGLTDHAEDLAPEMWPEYVAHCAECSDEAVRLIPGLEYRFSGLKGLHLLALGLSRWIAPRTPADFIRMTEEAAQLTVMAHPVLAGYQVPDAVRHGIGAVEVWNASYNTRFLPDPRAIDILHELRAERPEVVGTFGLDQHDRRNDRRVRVVVAHEAADPLAEIRAGRFTNVGLTMRLDPAVALSPLQLRALAATRWAFDRVERTQEHIARALAR